MPVGQREPEDPHRQRGLVAVGEALGLLTASGPGPLRAGSTLALGVGGAELNVAIGVARLGARATWIGRVGDDDVGRLVTASLRGEGVDVAAVTVDPDRPTSLLVRGPLEGAARRGTYYRRQGPGSRLRAEDVPDGVIASAAVLHVTGITPALSEGARATVRSVMLRARARGLAVTFDVNYRPALWRPAEARPVLEELIALADHVFAGEDEADAVGWGAAPERIGSQLSSLGARVVVVKRAESGAVGMTDGVSVHVPAAPADCVDLHGAGDAFAAGYISELMAGAPLGARLAAGAACAGRVISRPGDWEGLPRREELAR